MDDDPIDVGGWFGWIRYLDRLGEWLPVVHGEDYYLAKWALEDWLEVHPDPLIESCVLASPQVPDEGAK